MKLSTVALQLQYRSRWMKVFYLYPGKPEIAGRQPLQALYRTPEDIENLSRSNEAGRIHARQQRSPTYDTFKLDNIPVKNATFNSLFELHLKNDLLHDMSSEFMISLSNNRIVII